MCWPQSSLSVWLREQHARYAIMNPVVDADVVHGYGGKSGDGLSESLSPYPFPSAAVDCVSGDICASSMTTPQQHRGGGRPAHHFVDHRVHGLGNHRRVLDHHGHDLGVRGIHYRGCYHHDAEPTGSHRWDQQQQGWV